MSNVTYYDRPMLKPPVWIWTVPVYFYVGGVAGSALVLAASAQSVDRRGFRGLIERCRWIGLAGNIVGSFLLIVDLGRPERFFNMLRVFRPASPLSVGSWILASSGALAGASVLLPKRTADAAGLAAGAIGIPLAGYTGVLLADTAIPVWQSARRILPVLFVASGVASLASLLDLIELPRHEAKVVHRFGVAGKVAELAAMAAAERHGFSGTLWTAAKVLTAASLAISILPGNSKVKKVAGVAGTLAGIGLRFAVFYAGYASAPSSRA